MFRTMRRGKQLLSEESASEIMTRGSFGTLACIGDEGYPYSVPVNYVFYQGKIYLHSGKSGHKIDAILRNPKISFSVVAEDQIISAEYTSYFRSVIVFGRARIADASERLDAFQALIEKYSGDRPEAEKHRQATECNGALIVAIDIDQMTGKEAIELVRARE